MNKTRKLLRLLAGLGEEVTVRDVVEVHMDDGYTHIDITVDHKSHIRPCDKCGSERVIKHDRLESQLFLVAKCSDLCYNTHGRRY